VPLDLELTRPVVNSSFAWWTNELVTSTRHRSIDDVRRHVAIGNDVVVAAICDTLPGLTLSIDPDHPVPICGTRSPNGWSRWLGDTTKDQRYVKCNRALWTIHREAWRLIGGRV
jgi:hypothetical protein